MAVLEIAAVVADAPGAHQHRRRCRDRGARVAGDSVEWRRRASNHATPAAREPVRRGLIAPRGPAAGRHPPRAVRAARDPRAFRRRRHAPARRSRRGWAGGRLAAQKTLENIIAGASLIFDQAVRVGDFLKVGEIVGTVDEIGLRSTRIRTLDRTVVIVPNSQIASAAVETLSARDKFW